LEAAQAAQEMTDPGASYVTMAALAGRLEGTFRTRAVQVLADVAAAQPATQARLMLVVPVLTAASAGERERLLHATLGALDQEDDLATVANGLASIAPYLQGDMA